MNNLLSILCVFLGSGLGGVFRWAISTWLNGQYPIGTFMVNILGCFTLGILTKIAPGDPLLKLLLATGFCGGFTTFSTFINENFMLMRGSQLLFSTAYMLLSIVVGLLAAWCGYQLICFISK